MSFDHVLSSNDSVQAFPSNHASAFSTPISNPYDLEGSWEVSLVNLSHSNCISMFSNEKLTISEMDVSIKRLSDINQPYTLKLPSPPKGDRESLKRHVLAVNKTLKGFLQFDVDKRYHASYVIENKDFVYVVSLAMRNNLKLWSDVITDKDVFMQAFRPFNKTTDITTKLWSVTLVPKSFLRSGTHTLKAQAEKITPHELVKRFNSLVSKDISYMALDNAHMKNPHVVLHKPNNDGYLVLVNGPVAQACSWRQRGLYDIDEHRYYASNFDRNYMPEWTVTVAYIGYSRDYLDKLQKPISLNNRQFLTVKEVCDYLNAKIDDDRIAFKSEKNRKMTLNILDDHLHVSFDDDLKDILGFSRNEYSGKGNHQAEVEVSFTRRIDYLYIYSNISEPCRIGDTKAPLLAVIPFNPKPCRIVTEKSFKIPMYVPVLYKHISQIDIAIHDGSGKLIPFHEDAVTTLRLNFRRCHAK